MDLQPSAGRRTLAHGGPHQQHENGRQGAESMRDPEVLMEPWTSITYVRRLNPTAVRQDDAPICDERDIDLLADPYNRG
jgi:hypothetical protein